MNRRHFFASSAVFASTAALVPASSRGHAVRLQEEPPPQLDPEKVRQFVGASHGRIETVREMLAADPMYVNASWDWVAGDWETGLGAASHVGNRAIAELLLDHGARINVFAMTMLGHTDMMKAILATYPETHQVPGPHGIPMLSHAIFGKEPADEVFELLLESGADINAASNAGQTPVMAAAGTGRVEVVEHLIELGADTSATDGRGRTALDYAKSREHGDVVKLLTEK
ncbi:MAG: ankyrin repeat domain-containing protein [Pirellulaceae bacterium]